MAYTWQDYKGIRPESDGRMTTGKDLVTRPLKASGLALADGIVPSIIERAGPKARRRWVEFFTAELTNDNTRAAYALAHAEFFAWLEEVDGLGDGEEDLAAIRTDHVAAYREPLSKTPMTSKGKGGVMIEKKRSVPTIKLKLAALRSLFRYLKEGGVIENDPAASVRAPKHSVNIGKTAVLDGREAAKILDTLSAEITAQATAGKPSDLIAHRDRALIALMTFTLARISAAVGMNVGNIKMIGNRRHVELREKGGKDHVMPCHHELEDYLLAYIEAAGLSSQPNTPLFRAFDNKTRTLGGTALTRMKAWEMVQRRAKAAGVTTEACNHTFRATGITTFLENGGAIEKARDMAAHASIRTTQLYDRRNKAVKMDDVVLINLRGGKRSEERRVGKEC